MFKQIFISLLEKFRERRMEVLYSPFEGSTVPFSYLSDINLSQNVLGYTIAAIPSTNILKAPCDCTVKNISSDLSGISLQYGHNEIVINIGVAHNGKYPDSFIKPLVKVGQKVFTGDQLVEFNLGVLSKIDNTFVIALTLKTKSKIPNVTFTTSRYLTYDTAICMINQGYKTHLFSR